ncbi:MAG: SLOG family protein [Rikenellaceae bacterium]
MEIPPEITVAFTGNRLLEAPAGVSKIDFEQTLRASLRVKILELYNVNYRFFLTGGAVGFDMIAAEEVLLLREQHPDIRLIVVVPFRGQDLKYSEAAKARYAHLMECADKVVTICEQGYSASAYHLRNDFLVRNSNYVVAYSSGRGRGAASTLRRAQELGVESFNIYDDLLQNVASEQLSFGF